MEIFSILLRSFGEKDTEKILKKIGILFQYFFNISVPSIVQCIQWGFPGLFMFGSRRKIGHNRERTGLTLGVSALGPLVLIYDRVLSGDFMMMEGTEVRGLLVLFPFGIAC